MFSCSIIKCKDYIRVSLFILFGSYVMLLAPLYVQSADCPPTEPDSLGPYYKSDSPMRSSVDKGYLLKGIVKSSADCSFVRGAKIDFYMNGPDVEYDDNHRATLYSDRNGNYIFESNFPKRYCWRPPHIHILVTANGFKKLITQHYPQKGNINGAFDLVLIPVKK